MNAFIFGEDQKKGLQALKQHAEHNPFSKDALIARQALGVAPGDIKEFVVEIPVGLRVVYTIEAALEEGTLRQVGMMRHMTVSLDKGKKVPPPQVCQVIMEELGFKSSLGSSSCIIESHPLKNNVIAIAEIIEKEPESKV